jgi:hypothetical protein
MEFGALAHNGNDACDKHVRSRNEDTETVQLFQQQGIIDTKLLGFSHAECKSKAASTMCGSGRY